jgi:hypothetical protein
VDRRHRLPLFVAVTSVAALLVGCVVASARVDHHLDGHGPLGDGGVTTVDDGSSSSFSFFDNDPGPWTVGLQLCLAQGTGPAIIERVYPEETVGAGFRFVGALAHEIDLGAGSIGEIGGFPPRVAGKLVPASEFPVIYPCSPKAHGPYTELLVGIGKPPGSTGGGWVGIDVAYRVGARQYVVTLPQSYYACGPSAPAAAACDQMGLDLPVSAYAPQPLPG